MLKATNFPIFNQIFFAKTFFYNFFYNILLINFSSVTKTFFPIKNIFIDMFFEGRKRLFKSINFKVKCSKKLFVVKQLFNSKTNLFDCNKDIL